MKSAKILIFSLLMSLAITATAQQRGAGNVKIKLEDGQEQSVKLYEGSYALVIGESDYTNGWKDLPGVKNDVKAVGNALRGQGFAVTELLNATRAQLTAAIDEFINNYGYEANNRLLIYYAGHGHTQKSSDGRQLGYIVPSDAPLPEANERQFRQMALNMNEIENYARRMEAKHALFIFDSCFSGTLLTKRRSNVPPVITLKTTQAVRQFITAGSEEQEVPDESVFRREFVEALGGEGDLNNDGYITGSELADYLQTKVTNYTRGSQTPQYGKIFDALLDKGDFVFFTKTQSPSVNTPIIANNPTGNKPPNNSPTAPSKSATLAKLNDELLQAYENGNSAQETEIAGRILQIDGSNALALGVRASDKFENENDYRGALQGIRNALKLAPQDEIINTELMLLYLTIGKSRLAAKIAESHLHSLKQPKNSLQYLLRSAANLVSGDFNNAVRDADRTLELNPRSLSARKLRVMAHLALNDPKAALQDLNALISGQGESYESELIRANIALLENNLDAAEVAIEGCLMRKETGACYSTRANINILKKDFDAAIEDLTKDIAYTPFGAQSYIARALLYRAKGKTRQAEADEATLQRLKREELQEP